MLIFEQEKLVILSVPKTGTTALEAILAPRASAVFRNPPSMKHMPLYRYNRFLRPLLDKTDHGYLETVALIRNPLDWLGSWYRYRSRSELTGATSTAELKFEDFVLGYLRDKRPPFADIGSQHKFLTGDGDLRPNHLFQYEQFPLFLEFLSKRLGTIAELPRKNISPLRELEISNGTVKRFEKKFQADINLWREAYR